MVESSNGLVYSSSVYLDHMAEHWCGLVLDDYTAVMPLPWRSKWGIRYIYPPAFTQQLGISSTVQQSPDMLEEFLQAIPKKFMYLEANLNASNEVKRNFSLRKNYLLSFNYDYAALEKKYSRSARRNIVQATANHISVKENVSPEEILQLHRQRFKDNIGSNDKDYSRFLKLIQHLNNCEQSFCIGATNSSGHLIAGSIYTLFKDRVTFVINGNSSESLGTGATHFLMDYTIRHFAGKPFLLDFEGSDHPDFARFYEQYGAEPEQYAFIRYNRLPWPLRLLKPKDSDQKF